MRIPKHWAREVDSRRISGKWYRLVAWGYSDVSKEDAIGRASLRLQQIIAALSSGREGDRYDYHAGPIREERIDVLGSELAPEAVVTRNSYGSRVLNTERVMFVDVDFPSVRSVLRWWRGREAKVNKAIGVVERFVASNRSSGFRVYETAAGLRLLATDRLYDPSSAETARTLTELGADPLYQKLCNRQGCFRARLSPKPWRIGLRRSPVRFPEAHTREQQLRWCDEYERRARTFHVCRYLKTIGRENRVPTIDRVVRLHDQETKALSSGPLA